MNKKNKRMTIEPIKMKDVANVAVAVIVTKGIVDYMKK